ncbi:hypothetical protein D0Y65_004151 [Glycine soja]|uniref:Uncharacterized protein n=1 Tax=Glycine soja TaxID=3848 RepID=A0A445LQ62_GLYSO|nr:hypothetical protein D0Y65_004151 [Glycine soja]
MPLNSTPPTLTPAPTTSDPEPRAIDSHSLSNHCHHHHHNCTKPHTTTQTTPCRSHGTCAFASPRYSPRPHSRSALDLPKNHHHATNNGAFHDGGGSDNNNPASKSLRPRGF